MHKKRVLSFVIYIQKYGIFCTKYVCQELDTVLHWEGLKWEDMVVAQEVEDVAAEVPEVPAAHVVAVPE